MGSGAGRTGKLCRLTHIRWNLITFDTTAEVYPETGSASFADPGVTPHGMLEFHANHRRKPLGHDVDNYFVPALERLKSLIAADNSDAVHHVFWITGRAPADHLCSTDNSDDAGLIQPAKEILKKRFEKRAPGQEGALTKTELMDSPKLWGRR